MTQWGKYRLLKKIAQGGMAEIFVAERSDQPPQVGERVCLKRIRPEFSCNTEFLRMFEREALIATAIDHPNVVRVFDFDTQRDRCYIAMELIDGWDLKKVLNSAREIGAVIPIGFAFHVFRDVLFALEAATAVWVDEKEQCVIHRDISPHNIMVSKKGEVKLTDFGIAKSKDSSRLTQTGVIKGKLAYLAPEQVGAGNIGPATDLFGLGLVLYEMLAGHRFNRGQSEGEMLAAVMNPPSPSIPWLSEEVNRFLRTLLAAKEEDRFVTPTAALKALGRLSLPAYSHGDASLFLYGLITSEINHTVDAIDPQLAARSENDTVSDGIAEPRVIELRNGKRRGEKRHWRLNRLRWVLLLSLLGVVSSAVVVAWLWRQKEVRTDELRTDELRTDELRTDDLRNGNDAIVAAQTVSKVPESRADDRPHSGGVQPKKIAENDPVVRLSDGDWGESVADTAKMNRAGGGGHTADVPDAGTTVSSQDNRGTGTLQVLCRPWAHVKIDGKPAGITPVLNRRLKAGKHVVLLENEELNYVKQMTVVVRRGKSFKIHERIHTPERTD